MEYLNTVPISTRSCKTPVPSPTRSVCHYAAGWPTDCKRPTTPASPIATSSRRTSSWTPHRMLPGRSPTWSTIPSWAAPVLVDFGIARLVDQAGTQLTRPATAIGTAAYMSPEQARGLGTGPASDVYSLACVAYHAFLGRPPFTATSSVALARSTSTPPSRWPSSARTCRRPEQSGHADAVGGRRAASERPRGGSRVAGHHKRPRDGPNGRAGWAAGRGAAGRATTAVLPPQATASPTATLADGMAAVGPVVPVAAAATTGRPSPSPAPAEEEDPEARLRRRLPTTRDAGWSRCWCSAWWPHWSTRGPRAAPTPSRCPP